MSALDARQPAILLAGGTGTLGREVLRLLAVRSLRMRVLTGEPARARGLEGPRVEIVQGDVRKPSTLGLPMADVQTVISCMSGYDGRRGSNPRSVDGEGNLRLIRAAESAGASHFVLVSMRGAAPDHAIELLRMKFLAEQELRRSRLAWTIIRPTVFMETWARVVCEPLLKKGRALIFGRGENPINFVSAHDVAQFVELAVIDPAMRGLAVDVGGPDNLTLNQFADIFAAVTGRGPGRTRVPRAALRVLPLLMRRINPTLGRMAHDALLMDSSDFTFDSSQMRASYPALPVTSFEEVVAREYGRAGARPA